jgi:hypothetical protein
MAKNKISEYSSTAANNTDIGGINIAEGCAPSGINNAIRELMAQLKDQQAGTDSDNFVVGGAFTCTGAAVFSSTVAIAGSATAPTPTFADSTTKIATTAFVQAALAAVYPVGSIYINATSATNPATLLGFGTWVAFGAGRVPVGLDAGNAAFDTAEETGGSADAITVSHTHTTDTQGSHTHFVAANDGNTGAPYPNTTVTNSNYVSSNAFSSNSESYILDGTGGVASIGLTNSNGSHSHTTNSTGSSGTNANLQPYIVVRMWKRTV